MAKKDVKYVYFFGGKKAEGDAKMKNLLGGKGANLAEMVNMGLPVPAGFTITTEVCTYFYANTKQYPKQLAKQVKDAVKQMESVMGKKFGDPKDPLLLSVRSGARASMPGMMDTVLNLGLNDKAAEALVEATGNPRFVYDSYRRFVQMYGDVVLDLKPKDKKDHDPFEVIIEAKKKAKGVEYDTDLTTEDLKELVVEFKKAIKKHTGHDFPDDPEEQLWGAVGAVFNSWMNERAIVYRKLNNIPEEWGTAVNVQAMVFGNMGDDSGTGVAFTRDPATGENVFYGEYLFNAQGEDVVAGIRTPHPISKLAEEAPKLYAQLDKIRHKLEKEYKDMLDVEFTIQQGRLWMLQCRVGKRTGLAAVRNAVEMFNEGLIDKKTALMRVEPNQLNQLLRPIFDLEEKRKAVAEGKLMAKGLNAGPGAATGKVAFTAHDAEEMAKKGDPVILVRIETSPEDIKGMNASEGILTARGGMTSHAALVARQMGKVCVAGCGKLLIDYNAGTMKVDGRPEFLVKEGDYISIDGTTGEVILGKISTRPSEVIEVLINKTRKPKNSPMFQIYNTLMTWSDEFRKMGIRTNADQPDQAENALAFGAEGIGLCRTEHMFFGEDKIKSVRKMILSDTKEERKAALAELLPLQKKDFAGIFKAMKGNPVTVRTLDPPLHEFLPTKDSEIKELADEFGVPVKKVKDQIANMHEMNPMLGFRGCRLGVEYPEITEMQARAIFEAAVEVKKKGTDVKPEIMIPLVGHVNELKLQEQIVRRVAEEVFAEKKTKVDYLVGTMIELPRAALVADKIAEVAEFFSFGTNDLTQTTFGLSRDDAGKFLPDYVSKEILPADPFETIDQEGVGQLVEIGVHRGRSTKPKLKVGICGEHGGEPASVEFCYRTGLDYVSCSPFRVPIARLAAAQAALREKLAEDAKRKGKKKSK
ncbi:MAG: pyruvate, phosphate dikinase [Ignavibacteriales bacterium]|nr:MAG: pyruvate, phosphate dikinase [Ignavibacteriaceae bacterium]MBW7874278.1 pyruvate, phosphate dikinase [Ignavibacteria bacterium]MCZ2142678.1 pyruvate, phosphate dikinase [Ignavibacteriales bacterium]MBV6443776.1 Pyruvate, phosphate dikinase [Ignavibacteriaceae bacterium]MBZ0196611.1 pyruvate, phosphate dikinase [Ignavibacteriaceae bacterium]